MTDNIRKERRDKVAEYLKQAVQNNPSLLDEIKKYANRCNGVIGKS